MNKKNVKRAMPCYFCYSFSSAERREREEKKLLIVNYLMAKLGGSFLIKKIYNENFRMF